VRQSTVDQRQHAGRGMGRSTWNWATRSSGARSRSLGRREGIIHPGYGALCARIPRARSQIVQMAEELTEQARDDGVRQEWHAVALELAGNLEPGGGNDRPLEQQYPLDTG
jgi:hypothetical protein